MKSKILVLFMLIIPILSCSQTRLLNSFPTGDGVSKAYIGPAMMSMAKGMVGDYGAEFKDMVKDTSVS